MIRREGMALHPLVFQRIPLCKEGVPGWAIPEGIVEVLCRPDGKTWRS